MKVEYEMKAPVFRSFSFYWFERREYRVTKKLCRMNMSMNDRLIFRTAFAAVCGCVVATAAGAKDAPRSLTAGEILERVVGNTIVYQDDSNDHVEEFLAADGFVHGRSRVHGSYTSAWQIRFGHYLCLVSQDPMQSGCVQLVLKPENEIEFELDIGEKEGPFTLLAGNPSRL